MKFDVKLTQPHLVVQGTDSGELTETIAADCFREEGSLLLFVDGGSIKAAFPTRNVISVREVES